MSPSLPARSLTLALVGLWTARPAAAACGDGVHDVDEACDDGGRAPGDGCDAACQREPGWACTAATLAPAFQDVLYDEHEVRGGFHRPPSWVTSSTADSVQQLENAMPAVYGTSLPLSEVQLTMDLVATGAGDDFMGLTIGYTAGEHAREDADWLLLDWKRALYRSPDCKGTPGLALSRVRGPIVASDDLWCHTGAVHEIARANTLADTGWTPGVTYRVRLEYARSQVRVYVNNTLEISIPGVFPEGELGLYAFSQEGVQWTLVSPRDRTVCGGLDSDGDGLADPVEVRLGLDPQRADSDGDGVPDRIEVGDVDKPLDTDQDGVLNALDTDDDGDGAPTARESWDGDHLPFNDDTDRDGLPDFLDGDDDGDGLPTRLERYGGAASPIDQDSDGDGQPDMVDIDDDGDGVLTAVELGPKAGAPPDHDGDGIPDYRDPDDDGDGVPTAVETWDGDRDPGNDDTDRDGVPDYLDPDDDGDGLPTAEETGDSAGTRDADFDGRPDHIDKAVELPDGIAAAAASPSAEAPAESEPASEAPSVVSGIGDALSEGLTAAQDGAQDAAQGGCGCDSSGGVPAIPGLIALAALRRRRRSGHSRKEGDAP